METCDHCESSVSAQPWLQCDSCRAKAEAARVKHAAITLAERAVLDAACAYEAAESQWEAVRREVGWFGDAIAEAERALFATRAGVLAAVRKLREVRGG